MLKDGVLNDEVCLKMGYLKTIEYSSRFLTFVLLIAIEVEHALDQVLIEHRGVAGKQEVDHTELPKPLQLRINQTTHETEEERSFPLDIVFL